MPWDDPELIEAMLAMRRGRREAARRSTSARSAGVRSLHFGSHWIQGAMRIARPYALELDYTRDMMLALLLRSARRVGRGTC
jgi:hypothetical protein